MTKFIASWQMKPPFRV